MPFSAASADPLESPGCGAAAEPPGTPTSPAPITPAPPAPGPRAPKRGGAGGARPGTVSAGVLSGKPLPRSPWAPRARHQTTTHNPRPRPLQPEPHRQHPPTPVEPRPHRRHPARPDRTEAAPERSRSPETPRHHGHVRNPPTPCTTSWNDWGSRVFDERSKPGSRRILMPTLIFRRLCGMAAVPVLMLGLSACTIHSQADPDEVARVPARCARSRDRRVRRIG